MLSKPDLIIFSQNLLGGGASFHRNMVANFPRDFFEIKCVFINPVNWHGAKALDIVVNPNDVIFSYGNESVRTQARNLGIYIPNTKGAVVTNLENELVSLDLFRKPKKTVYFICHDDGFIHLAVKYESIIDVFIAHNITVYNDLIALLSKRKERIFFIQHGVSIPYFTKKHINEQKLKIVFLARHHAFKGIYDLPVINDMLLERGVQVDWMILGDGPERNNLIEKVKHYSNFQFNIPKTSADVLEILKTQDVFILPSRADGLPVALLESMSVGCVPVIANFSEGIKKVVTGDIGFVIPVGDNAAFAEKIDLLSRDRALLQSLSNNCIEKVKSEFDIKNQALEYYNLYKNYNQFSRKHTIGLLDLKRIISTGKYYSKTIFLIKAIKNKIMHSATA